MASNVTGSSPIPQPSPQISAPRPIPRPAAAPDPIAQLIQAEAPAPRESVTLRVHAQGSASVANTQMAAALNDGAQGINTRAVFTNGNAATGAQLDSVLRHYRSPHVGQGETIARIAREENINPVLLLAVMQKESSYGNKANTPSLKEENIRNPFSVHFHESAEGIKKLRLPSGEFPTFEQSLRGAIRTLKRHAGDSATPLSTTSKKYCPPHHETWTREVTANYERQMRRIQK